MKRSVPVLFALLAASTAFAGYEEDAQEAYRTQFRAKMIDSCTEYNTVAFCKCCADQLMAERTAAQLQDKESTLAYLDANIIPGCREREASGWKADKKSAVSKGAVEPDPALFKEPVRFSGPLSIPQIEAESMKEVAANPQVPQAPLGRAYREWERFKWKLRPGDLIYFYDETADAGRVSSGYALVRDGRAVERIETRKAYR